MIQFKMAFLLNDVKEILAYSQENQPDDSFFEGTQVDAGFDDSSKDAGQWFEQVNPGRIFRDITGDNWSASRAA